MMNNSSLNKPRRRSASRSRMFNTNFSRSKWVLVMLTMAWPLCLATREFTYEETQEFLKVKCVMCGAQDHDEIYCLIDEDWTYYNSGECAGDAEWWCPAHKRVKPVTPKLTCKLRKATGKSVDTMTLKEKKLYFRDAVRNAAKNHTFWSESKHYSNYSLEDMEENRCKCGNYLNPAISDADCGSLLPFWRITDNAYTQVPACSFGMGVCKALSVEERENRAMIKWKRKNKRVLSRWRLQDGTICERIDAKTAKITSIKGLNYGLKFDCGAFQYIDKDDFERDYLISVLDGKNEAKIIRNHVQREQRKKKHKMQRLRRKIKEGKRNKQRRLFSRSTPRRRFF